jgi:hypothetical protein
MCALGYVAVTHVAIVAPADVEAMRSGVMVAGEPIGEVAMGRGRRLVMATNYVYSKRASVMAIAEEWPLGIGPGRHGAFIGELQAQGRHPRSLWRADPHSTYLGAAAELGAAGVAGLVALWTTLALTLVRLSRSRAIPRVVWAGLVGVAVAVTIEAICTDVMNFRHYWWVIAVVAAWAAETAGVDGRTRQEVREGQ